MTQQILFIIVIFIGAAYARHHGNKAKRNIEKLQRDKAKDEDENKLQFLEVNIFNELRNLNSGFDSESIKYFSEKDFKIVLNRIQHFNLGISGIEPWLNGEFYNVLVAEDFGSNPFDPNWYNQAFEKLKKENNNLIYAATYVVPTNLL